MFKGPEAQASIPGRLKVWTCRKGWVGSPAPCPPLPVLPRPQADDPRVGPDITGVLVYTCGQPCTCVLAGTVSAHRPIHSLGTQFCGRVGDGRLWHVKAPLCA